MEANSQPLDSTIVVEHWTHPVDNKHKLPYIGNKHAGACLHFTKKLMNPPFFEQSKILIFRATYCDQYGPGVAN